MTSFSRGAALQHLIRRLGGNPADDRTDGQLLEQFTVHHDEAAFAVLVQRHGPLVLGLCQRILSDGHDAEDAFQATFLVLARRAASLDRQRALGTWLYTVAHHLALKVRANAARRRGRERQVTDMPAAQPPDAILWREVRVVLDAELGRLPEKYRAPLVLCYLQGKSNEAAARELGWPVGSIAKRLTRGRELLRERLTGRGVVLSSAALAALLPTKASAAVSVPLVEATSRAAVGFIAGTAAAGTVSTTVATLAEGAVHGMFVAKWKSAAWVAVVLVLLGSGGGVTWMQLASGPATAIADGADPEPAPPNDPRITAIRNKLAQRVTLEGFDPGTPLKDALAFLSGKCNVPIHIDTKAFQAIGLPTIAEQPVAFPKFTGIKFALLLDMLLNQIVVEDYGVRYRVAADGVTIIPVKDDAPASEPVRMDEPDPATLKKLSQPINLDKGIDANTPLKDALEFLADRYDLKIIVNSKVFEAMGVQKVEEQPVKLLPQIGTPLGRVLQLLTEQIVGDVYRGTYFVVDDVILIGAGLQLTSSAPGGKLLATTPGGGVQGRIVLRQAETGQEVRSLPMPGMTPVQLAFAPDGKKLAVCYISMAPGRKESSCLWDVATGKLLRQWTDPAFCLFTPDSKGVLGASDGALTLVDAATGNKLREFANPNNALQPLGFSASGRSLATSEADPSGTHSFVLLEVASGKELQRFALGRADQPEKSNPWSAVAVSPDGKLLVAGYQTNQEPVAHKLGLWEVATGQRLAYFQGEGKLATFSPDGRLLAVTNEEGTRARLWDVRTGKELTVDIEPKQPIAHLGFMAGEQALILVGADGVSVRWNVPALAPLEAARAVRLTPAEVEKRWHALAGDDLAKVQEARLDLAAAGELAIAFIRDRLSPVSSADVRALPQWVANLDSNQFAVRQQAAEALAPLLELAEPELRRLLAGKPSLEVRQRLDQLLAEVQGPFRSPTRLRIVRGIDVLELAATPEARKHLQALAAGVAGALATKEAQGALERMARRAAVVP